MPISSFHGLRKNSIPTKPWNSTRSSPQRSSPTGTRKRSIFGVPQLWTSNEFQDAFEDDQDIERYYNKCSGSPVVNNTPKSRGKTLRKSSLNSQPNSARIKRVGLKRRETFPKFSGECSRRSEAAKVLRRSQTDPTIFPADKKPRKDNYKPPKRPSLLWTVSKKEENSSTKFRRRKISKSHSPPSSSSPDGSVDSSFSRKRPRQGDKVVCILNKTPQLGILKYIGTTHFADGEWCGILLDEPCGKNDGSVRGVRYFRCRNKYGIFVHSHKVKRADETTLSRLNLLDGFPSLASTEKPDEKGLDTTISRMSSSNVDKVSGGNNIYKHPDVKSLRLTKKNRSVSLDRILFQKTKQLAKSLNIFIQNATDKGDKNSWDPNRINRSVSLPKITKNGHYSSTDDCLAGEMAPIEKGENIVKEERSTANGEQKGLNRTTNSTCDSGCEKEDINSSRKPSECLEDCSKHCNSSRGQNIPRSVTVVPKVGHAVSLDTHLLMENGQSSCTATDVNDELGCQSHFGNKDDPFLQGRHCSCPSLHSDDHFSEAIKTCLSLGRAERAVIHETNGETEATLETAQVSGFSFNHGVQPHSQSEALEKLFQKTEIGRRKSSSSRDADLGRKGSWPWLTSTPKSSLRSYGSSDDINSEDMTGNDNVLDEGYRPILAHAKLISSHLADKSFRLDKSGTFSGTGDIVLESEETGPVSSGKDSVDSNYANSLSGSQGSLSSTGTSDCKGKKIPAKNRIPINSAKIPGSKPSGIRAPKSIPKQSKLEQIRQQQHNHKSALPSAVNRAQLADQTTANPGKKTDSKMTKRHTLATVQDVKTSVPRPSVCKRPVSDGVASLVGNPDKELDAKSKLPVKKMSMPQFSKPSTALNEEKNSKATTLIHKRHSVATSRPPTAPLAKRTSSVARSNSKTQKLSDIKVVLKSESNDQGSGVVRQKVTGAQQTPSASSGLKGVAGSGPKSQTSRAIQSSNLPKAKGPLAKEAKSRPAPVSSNKKPASQTGKQITKQPPSSQRPGSSKLPRKRSAAPSNASDSASVTSSIKDQDNLDDLHDADIDTVSVSTDTSDRDTRLPSYGHFQQDEADGKVESPIEAPSCRIMPPDILSETPYLSKHSIGIQVEDDSDSKTIQALKEKGRHLHELVKQRTELCWQLQDQIDEDSLDFVSASVMILSVVHKLQWSQRCSDQLQRKIQSTMEELSVIQEKLAEEEANSVKLQEEMMYQSSEHAVAIETLKADYENVLERTSNELKMKHEGEIALAIETHKTQVHEMRQNQEKEMSELKKSHEEVIASVKEAHRDEIVELESKHSSATDELVEEHQVEIETIKADYDEQQSEFKEKYDKAVSDCSMLNKKLQQAQDQNQKDIETRIQEEIKKYESLPAELESLKAVLEMKNEEIKRLRKEKMEKHLELEKLEDIKTQTQKLQQENESLSFVVETKSRFERQLSVERDSLRNSLERESAKSKRLSLENEELQWRLINSTSPPGSPSDDGRPLSASSRNSFRLSASFPDVEAIDE